MELDKDILYRYTEFCPSKGDVDLAINAEDGEIMSDWRINVLNNANPTVLREVLQEKKDRAKIIFLETRYLFEPDY